MSQIASSIYKQLVAKKQSALGTKATAGSAQIFRRVSSTLDEKKKGIESKEILPSQQRRDFLHGVRSTDGKISGELSPGTYQGWMESVLRSAFAAVSAYSAGSDVTAQEAAPQFTDASAGFLTAGLKVGMVGRWTGFAGGGATTNNARNFLITALTASQMTGVFLDGTAVVADAAGDTVTFTPVGKELSIPVSGHTRDYWTIEHNFSDITQSEQFVDSVFTDMGIKVPASGMATVDFSVMGLSMDESTSEYFTTPTAASTSELVSSLNGAIYVNGVSVGLITAMDVSIKGNHGYPSGDGSIGTDTYADIMPGPIDVSGNMTVLFQDATMRDYFRNETEVAIIAALTTGNGATDAVQTIVMPRCKVNSSDKDEGEKGIAMKMPFVALENTAGGSGTATNATTITIQDSAAA